MVAADGADARADAGADAASGASDWADRDLTFQPSDQPERSRLSVLTVAHEMTALTALISDSVGTSAPPDQSLHRWV